ncbi:MAG: ABC transporter permease [Ktedonobacterales bacterium]
MIADIWAMMWKEWHEYIAGGSGGRGRGVFGVLLIIGIVSILLPLRSGRDWVTSPGAVLLDGAYLPFTILLNVVADSFAGERERHTLETLLASRLSDRAILFGKVGAAVAYGWALGLAAALLQLVVANISHPAAGIAIYPAGTIFSIVVLGLLVSLLATSAGCLISLRAATTRQAQQTLGIGFLVLVLVPVVVIQTLPATTRNQIVAQIVSTSPTQLLLTVSGVLLALDVVLLLAAMARFQRTRLIMG